MKTPSSSQTFLMIILPSNRARSPSRTKISPSFWLKDPLKRLNSQTSNITLKTQAFSWKSTICTLRLRVKGRLELCPTMKNSSRSNTLRVAIKGNSSLKESRLKWQPFRMITHSNSATGSISNSRSSFMCGESATTNSFTSDVKVYRKVHLWRPISKTMDSTHIFWERAEDYYYHYIHKHYSFYIH